MSRSCLTSVLVLVMSLLGPASLLAANGVQPAKKLPRKSQPVSPSHAAPDVTATIPAKPTPPAIDDDVIPAPFYLPAAPRARLRTCGQQWDGIKMAGAAGNRTWREFATQCLAQSAPSAKP